MEQVGLNWGEEAECRVEKGIQGVTKDLLKKTSGLKIHDGKFTKNL